MEFTDPDYLSPYLQINRIGTINISIDWGDNSTPYSDTLSSSGYIQHTFPSVGKYTIKISIAESDSSWMYWSNGQGNNHSSILLIIPAMSDLSRNMTYANSIKAIRIGNKFAFYSSGTFRTLNNLEYITIPNTILNVSDPTNYGIGRYDFTQCMSLKSITLPRGVIAHANSANTFENCYALKNISIPRSFNPTISLLYSNCRMITHPYIPFNATKIENSYFNAAVSLHDVVLPNSITEIGISAFNTCASLIEITIPASVTSIGDYAFRYNYGITAYHFLPTTPPTLGGSTVFGGINANCKIYVPAASVNAYKTATNWSTYASYIEAEPT